MDIKVNVTINKPIAEVWEVMGNQFGHVHIWSSNFKTSKPYGDIKFKGLDYSLRNTTTDRGNTIQELTEFNPTNYSLSYEITKGAPEIARKAGATWSLSHNGDKTIAQIDAFMETKVPLNDEMEKKIKMGLTASFNELAEELKYYLETGKPHPNKLKQTL